MHGKVSLYAVVSITFLIRIPHWSPVKLFPAALQIRMKHMTRLAGNYSWELQPSSNDSDWIGAARRSRPFLFLSFIAIEKRVHDYRAVVNIKPRRRAAFEFEHRDDVFRFDGVKRQRLRIRGDARNAAGGGDKNYVERN